MGLGLTLTVLQTPILVSKLFNNLIIYLIMRKYIMLIFLIIFCSIYSFGQTSPSEQLAQRIANKMRDTLTLTALQTQSMYNINLNLDTRKMQARTISTDRIIVGRAIQAVEKTRDSLYRIGLTAPQYELYLQKKKNIVKNN